MDMIVYVLLVLPLQLLLLVGVPYLFWRRLRSRRPSTAPVVLGDDGSGGKVIPIVAGFLSLRGWRWVGLATNNLNPLLVVERTGITFRVLRKQRRSYEEVSEVDVRIFGGTVNLCFSFRDSPVGFDANLGNIRLAEDVLRLLPSQVRLTPQAAALLTPERRDQDSPTSA